MLAPSVTVLEKHWVNGWILCYVNYILIELLKRAPFTYSGHCDFDLVSPTNRLYLKQMLSFQQIKSQEFRGS